MSDTVEKDDFGDLRITNRVVSRFLSDIIKKSKIDELVKSGIHPVTASDLVGEVIDPVEGVGNADPNIWGPVVDQ